MDNLLLPFQLPFMQNAMLILLILSVPMAILSCFLVLKGWALMGDAISHAVLPGVVLAYWIGLPIGLGAFAAGMFCAVATGYLGENSRVKQDTVMGVVFAGMFGLGTVMYVARPTSVHLDHILFGDMLGIWWPDIWTTLAVSLPITIFLILKGRDLMLHAFDPVQAEALGLPVTWLHYGLLAAISLAVVAALKAVGIILAIGLLIAPGAIAFLITRRFVAMQLVAVAVTLISGFLGTYMSLWIDSAPAPTIILVLTLFFIAAFLWSARRNAAASRQARQPA
ncbi:metal ABC transporter permease [Paracoccaceae bacterium GXU_MW_L88]